MEERVVEVPESEVAGWKPSERIAVLVLTAAARAGSVLARALALALSPVPFVRPPPIHLQPTTLSSFRRTLQHSSIASRPTAPTNLLVPLVSPARACRESGDRLGPR